MSILVGLIAVITVVATGRLTYGDMLQDAS